MTTAQISLLQVKEIADISDTDDNNMNRFEIIWIDGRIEIMTKTTDIYSHWTDAIYAAICDCIDDSKRTIGWRHFIKLGTIHSAVVTRDIELLEKYKDLCEQGLLEYNIFDLPE